MRAFIAVVLIAVCNSAALAQPGGAQSGPDRHQPPRLAAVSPDWEAARKAAVRSPSGDEIALPRLNEALAADFPGIGDSPLPVLLPLDVARLMRDRESGSAGPVAGYLAGFRPTGFFLTGPAGYDAAFSVRTAETDNLRDIRFADPVVVEISASAFHYMLPPPSGVSELPVRGPEAKFPNIRRFILEHYLRYSFEAFGVTYVVSISCFDGRARPRWISCQAADRIAVAFIEALTLAGGTPSDRPLPVAVAAERPRTVSSVFTYHAPGDLIPNTGFQQHGGVADRTVYMPMRFPFADAPAFVNSQSFMNWGDCDQTGRTPHPRGRKNVSYRCRLNDKPLVFFEGAAENYSYPWRDNFCERRHFAVGQCPGGRGHQGVDIRPATCELKNEGADRCQAYRDDLVAVRAGMILRAPKQESVYLTVNAPGEHVRVRYLHMHPDRLDDAGLVSGRRLAEAEVIGRAGNFNRRDNLTTYHLHFEMFVPTREGWVRVNPYMTLVAAYERLIRARGREIESPARPAEPATDARAPGETERGATVPNTSAAKKKRIKRKKRRR